MECDTHGRNTRSAYTKIAKNFRSSYRDPFFQTPMFAQGENWWKEVTYDFVLADLTDLKILIAITVIKRLGIIKWNLTCNSKSLIT